MKRYRWTQRSDSCFQNKIMYGNMKVFQQPWSVRFFHGQNPVSSHYNACRNRTREIFGLKANKNKQKNKCIQNMINENLRSCQVCNVSSTRSPEAEPSWADQLMVVGSSGSLPLHLFSTQCHRSRLGQGKQICIWNAGLEKHCSPDWCLAMALPTVWHSPGGNRLETISAGIFIRLVTGHK